MTDIMTEILACGPCQGKGKRYGDVCDFCGGTGARYRCYQRDCYEYGCIFGQCYVPDDIARQNGFPL